MGVPPRHERPERPPHEVLRDRLRRVERAGRFPNAGSALERDASVCMLPGLVVEERLVYAAELLDAEVAIRNRYARIARRSRTGRQREHDAACCLVIDVASIGEGRVDWREEAAVERRDAEVARAASRVRQ